MIYVNEKGEKSTAFELEDGLTVANLIIEKFQPEKTCHQIEIAGSIRRKRSTIGDIEIVAQPKQIVLQRGLFDNSVKYRTETKLDKQIAKLFDAGFFTGYVKNGPRYKQIWVEDRIKLDLFLVLPPAQFGMIMLIRTGSVNYSHQFVTRVKRGGWYKCQDGALYRRVSLQNNNSWKHVATPTEQSVYDALGWTWIPPAERD